MMKSQKSVGQMKQKRERPKITKTSYFVSEKPGINFISSGCTLLDCALGGGYAIGRIVNIVGDKSTAKTALAAEAMINFLLKHPTGAVRYCETEAAFDSSYAAAMGLQIDKVDFGDPGKPIMTVEEFARDFDKFLDAQIKEKLPGIYVLDSLDALSDEAEMERDVGEASYGMAKAKMLSEFFRKTARRIEQSQVLLVVVSQVRENIGVTFGEKYRRAGGKALDFYASQIFWLSAVKPLKRTIAKIERAYGVMILAKIKKNKVGLQFREASFDFIFGFGVDDVGASIRWLNEVGHFEAEVSAKEYLALLANMTDAEYNKERQLLAMAVKEAWAKVETSFLPTRSKYA
jgi:recombination protein RecA